MSKPLVTLVTVKFTVRELELLTALASDQLFRREFIDPKMNSNRDKPEEIILGKSLVQRMRVILDPNAVRRMPSARIAG
jgi:hypothetical protein